MSDFTAMLVVQLEGADRVRTEMFAARMKELGWQQPMPGVWTLEFEARARNSCAETVKGHLDLACRFARVQRGQAKAIVHFGDDGPLGV